MGGANMGGVDGRSRWVEQIGVARNENGILGTSLSAY